ncbi:MAG TPA: hypothetical protein VIT18_04460 [Terrimicrobiaceae bacterium]
MTVLLRLFAVLCAVTVIACWFSLGAHLGWTQTLAPVKKSDPVTEIEFTDYEARLVPGVDFLCAGLLGSAAIFALTFAIPNSRKRR